MVNRQNMVTNPMQWYNQEYSRFNLNITIVAQPVPNELNQTEIYYTYCDIRLYAY